MSGDGNDRGGDGRPVGYKSPPAGTRFRKGSSGNPRGRPKGRKNADTIFREMLTERVKILIAGKMRTVTKIEALIHTGFARAMKGDAKMAELCIKHGNNLRADANNNVNDEDLIINFVRSEMRNGEIVRQGPIQKAIVGKTLPPWNKNDKQKRD